MIIYYDFKFAFDDIVKIMDSFLRKEPTITNVLVDIDRYKKLKKKYKFYIDNDWVHNVAKLSPVLSNDEIQMIYELYGELSTIQKVFNTSINEISEDEDKAAYSIMFNNICNVEIGLKHPIRAEVTLKNDIKFIMGRLKKIGEVERRTII